MFQTYHPRTFQSVDYYVSVVRNILASRRTGRTYEEMAINLNEVGLRAPTGHPFTANGIKMLFAKLRARRGNFHAGLMQAVYDGLLTPAELAPLLPMRAPGKKPRAA